MKFILSKLKVGTQDNSKCFDLWKQAYQINNKNMDVIALQKSEGNKGRDVPAHVTKFLA